MKKYIPQAFIILVICYLLFLIRPAMLGQLGGTLQSHTVPQEYRTLEKFLESQSSFFRTLWIPSLERYGYYSPTHPAINAEDMYHVASVAGVLNNLKKQEAEAYLAERSIKYVIIPYDAEKEIFLKDRKYDDSLFHATVATLQNIPWLQEVPGFGNIHVFVLKDPKDHFWIKNNMSTKITYQTINPTLYKLSIRNGKKGDRIIFTDAYDKNWQMIVSNQKVVSLPYENTLNSFVLPQSGNYSATIYYASQRLVNIGLVISLITAVSIIVYFFIRLIQVYFRKAT